MLKYDRCQRYFEDEIAEGSSIEDIDEGLIDIYREKLNIRNMTTEEILKARKFLVDGELTNAAILLFSNNPTNIYHKLG